MQITYTEAQSLILTLQGLPETKERREIIWKGFGLLDNSYTSSIESGRWQECEMPDFEKYGFWQKGIPQSSYPNSVGARRTWWWKQPRNEDFIYCITETRQPIDATNKDSKWETIVDVGRKPLVLTSDAQVFFADLKGNHEIFK